MKIKENEPRTSSNLDKIREIATNAIRSLKRVNRREILSQVEFLMALINMLCMFNFQPAHEEDNEIDSILFIDGVIHMITMIMFCKWPEHYLISTDYKKSNDYVTASKHVYAAILLNQLRGFICVAMIAGHNSGLAVKPDSVFHGLIYFTNNWLLSVKNEALEARREIQKNEEIEALTKVLVMHFEKCSNERMKSLEMTIENELHVRKNLPNFGLFSSKKNILEVVDDARKVGELSRQYYT